MRSIGESARISMLPYELRRPNSRVGVGSIKVFRAISRDSQPLRQTPVAWIKQQVAYGALSMSPDPAEAARLHAAGVPVVPKVWTELAYESVRARIAPHLPSRMDCLFAFVDPLEAFALEQVTNTDKQVWEGDVEAEVPWCLVDMAHFRVVHPTTIDEGGFRDAWVKACEHAHTYWTPGDPVETAELLVCGPILLERKLTLLDLFLYMGIVAPHRPHPRSGCLDSTGTG